MNTLQSRQNQSLLSKFLFWAGEIIGIVFIIPLLLFVGGNIVEELINGVISIKEEYVLFIFLVFLFGVAIGLALAWFRARTGAWIVSLSSIAALLSWGFDGLSMSLMLLPLLVSGALLLFYAYRKKNQT